MNSKKNNYDLNSLVKTYNIDNVYEQYKRLEFVQKLSKYVDFNESSVLELGSATGNMTEILSKITKNVVAVDGSSKFIEIAKQRVVNTNNVSFYESYFENFSCEQKFDCLVLHHILEHLENPVQVLKNLRNLLKKDGLMAISVPNARALSRQLAVKMDLLKSIYNLTENDIHHGHFRVYDLQSLEKEIVDSGYSIVAKHGLSLKLFSDKQNVEMLNANIIGENQIKGLWKLGDDFIDISGALMFVAKSDAL